MKNLYILSTDKPSRLNLGLQSNSLVLLPITVNKTSLTNPQNIYITSDEEIKVGDWVYSIRGFIGKFGEFENSYINECKKIILTTDQDLIGVQAIDDEFLQWFVKNPSCERVEVKRNKKLSNKSIWDAIEGDLIFNNHNCGGIITMLSSDVRVHITSENGEGYMETAITSDNGIDTLVINNYKVYEYTDYKIIIPKKEPKQEFEYIGECKGNDGNGCFMDSPGHDCGCFIRKPKQETTLEEAAKEFFRKFKHTHIPDSYYLALVEFSKLQSERMYSEEEVFILLAKMADTIFRVPKRFTNSREWFNKFKKK